VGGLAIGVPGGVGAVPGGQDIGRPAGDPLRDQETEGELEVVAGGPHRHGNSRAADANLERLLDGDPIAFADTGRPFLNLCRHDTVRQRRTGVVTKSHALSVDRSGTPHPWAG
jgi:hypothetical protein